MRVPLIQTVPGAPDASLAKIAITLGSAITEGGHQLYVYTLPSDCPKHYLALKAEATFAENGLESAPVTVPATFRAPCPLGAELAPQTSLPGTGGTITAPSNKECVSRRDFDIHVIQIKGLVYRQVSVEVNGHTVSVVRGSRIGAPVDLRGLPKGRYTVRIAVTTTSGRRITATRSYHTCATKPLPAGKHRL
jgi:hypothetical protein